MRWILPLLLVSVFVLSPFTGRPAAAANVSVTLIASGFAWHVGTDTSTDTSIEVNVGDTLQLRVENHDTGSGSDHTFTAPQFAAVTGQGGGGTFLNFTLVSGAVRFWNHTISAADVATWQFYCFPHSAGTYPSRTGMIGTLVFRQPTPPPTPGFEVLAVMAALVAAFVVVRRRRK